MKFLDGYTEHSYALLRIVAGLLFTAHGVQKLFNFPVAFEYPLNPVLYAAASSSCSSPRAVPVSGASIASGPRVNETYRHYELSSPPVRG